MNLIDNKHIPKLYLTSSRTDRLELLAGLIDTDGSLSEGGFEITQKSNVIAEDILFLARSLGYAAYSQKSLKSSQNGTEGEYNRVFISGDLSEVPVRLERKKARERKQIKSVLRTGFNVEVLGVDNYYGFTLDSDHLYLTKDFTIHHNTGKTTIIAESARKYNELGSTFTLVWHTDKIEAGDVKDFIKHLQYEGVEQMILVVEDIGGIEIDNARIRSESALLSLLDNQEQTFKVPTLILATTNYPENFMGNLTNRPNRFDDKIRVGFPPAAARQELLKFYDKEGIVNDEALKLVADKKCETFSPAHLREVIIRSVIYDQTPDQTIKQMIKEIAEFNRAFAEKAKSGVGLRASDDDYDY
jgi:SpoVK/Ycf46/Vps4 family AAA+-type ATPase